jgi:hypothetical protein
LQKRQRLAKAYHVKKQSNSDQHTALVAQYAALYALRKVAAGSVDDSQYIHALTYRDLSIESFRELLHDECQQLQCIVKCLESIQQVKAVPVSLMRSALTTAQYENYLASFDLEMSHVEADDAGDMPYFLHDYLAAIKQGDKYTRIAKMLRRAKKKDANGQTAFGRNEAKAFGYCYVPI